MKFQYNQPNLSSIFLEIKFIICTSNNSNFLKREGYNALLSRYDESFLNSC